MVLGNTTTQKSDEPTGDDVASAGYSDDLYNWYVKTYGAGAAGWYMNNPNSNPKNNPFLPGGSYVPKAEIPRSGSNTIAGLDEPIVIDPRKKNNKKPKSMTASFKPEGLSLFERLKQKRFFNPNDIKPVFPENPPPELDPKTGMHPNYGKHAKRYRKLDPASANAMPPTGDPEIDAIVDKQRTKPKTKLYDKLKKNIRKDLTNK